MWECQNYAMQTFVGCFASCILCALVLKRFYSLNRHTLGKRRMYTQQNTHISTKTTMKPETGKQMAKCCTFTQIEIQSSV